MFRFFDVLRKSTTVETLDLERIKYIIEREIKKLYSKVGPFLVHS